MKGYPFESMGKHGSRGSSNLSETKKLVDKGSGKVGATAKNPFEGSGGSGSETEGRQIKPFGIVLVYVFALQLQLPCHREQTVTTP